ncbi:MAG: VWA domain-containing protein [Euzebyales bacterium]|nr:VWA domain-containing protein [Euzebyales bacterium]
MKRRVLSLPAIAIAAVLFAGMPTAVAGEGETSLRISATDVERYPDVAITLTAPTILDGGTLGPDAFSLLEDGADRRFKLSRVAGDELEVVLVIDTSGSMSGAPMVSAKAAASSFVRQLPSGSEVAVLGFGSEPTLASPFTTSAAAAARAIDRLRPSGETALYDALARALREFPAGSGAQRAVVVLSDGADTASETTSRATRSALREAEVGFFGVSLTSADGNGAALRDLSKAVNGRVVAAHDAAALADVYADIAAELRSRYLLTYRSDASGPTPVEVVLEQGSIRASAREVLSLPTPATAPDDAPAPSGPPTLRVVGVDDSAYPNMEVTVVAPRGLAKEQLDAASFSLEEGGLPADVSVAPVKGQRLEVVVAVDVSGSMAGEPLDAAKAAAVDFIDAVPDGTQVAVLAFAGRPRLVASFTSDKAQVTEAVDALVAGGETSLYDAAVEAASLFAGRQRATRSVVLLSDGGDTVSVSDAATAAEKLAEAHASVEAVNFKTPEAARQALADLATPTGGSITPVEDAAGLAVIYEGLAMDLGNQYVLRYRSRSRGETVVAVEVEKNAIRAEALRTVVLPPLPWREALFGSRLGLALGAMAMYLAMALTILLLLAPRPPRASLAAPGGGGGRTHSVALSGLGDWAKERVERTLRRRGWSHGLNERLEQAGLLLRPGEFVLLVAGAASVLMSAGSLAAGPLAGLALALLVALAAKVLLDLRARRRRSAFCGQLGDTLQMLAGSLRTGYGLLQAIDAVARESDAPTCDEFRRIVLEARLGRDLATTLRALSARINSEDFEWVVQAIEIHHDIGGDLAEVLDEVASTIRERAQVFRQVRALSAEGRLSAAILLALPFVVIGGISITNPSYMDELFSTSVGLSLLAGGAVLMSVGALWLRKIVKPVF